MNPHIMFISCKIETPIVRNIFLEIKKGTMTEPVKVIKRCPYKDCKKKLSLTDYSCKCGVVYCPTHRNDIVHNCTFDWEAENKNKLNKNLPLVNGKKLETF